MSDITRRDLLRYGLGAAGTVALLPRGGRILAGPAARAAGASPLPEAAAAAGQQAMFGRMFPDLQPFSPDADLPTALGDLATLADAMLEPGGGVDTTKGAIYTYLGQFLDHDVTLDLQPQPSAFFSFSGSGKRAVLLDPSGAPVPDFESKKLDLSQIYGGGPDASPQLYDTDGIHFLVPKNVNGVVDLPRRDDGTAIIVETRNDENQITSQLHVALLLFHNAVADAMGTKFARTRKIVTQYYQWVVLHDFMPTMFGQATIDSLRAGNHRVYDPGAEVARPIMPVEFSSAAYRFGHSMIRNAYSINPTLSPNNKPSRNTLFTGVGGATGPAGDGLVSDLHGGYPLPASHVIDWGNFAAGLFNPATAGQSLQVFKQIGGGDGLHMIGQSMFGQPDGQPLKGTGAGLPIGGPSGAAPSGSNSIAYRDLVRGLFYLLPSGQDVAAAYGITPIAPTTVIDPSVAPGFANGTPLWFYVLYETYAQNTGSPVINDFDNTGTAGDFTQVSLGPVGARICTDVFLRLLNIAGLGVLSGRFQPAPPIAPVAGQFGIEDLLVFAGVAARP